MVKEFGVRKNKATALQVMSCSDRWRHISGPPFICPEHDKAVLWNWDLEKVYPANCHSRTTAAERRDELSCRKKTSWLQGKELPWKRYTWSATILFLIGCKCQGNIHKNAGTLLSWTLPWASHVRLLLLMVNPAVAFFLRLAINICLAVPDLKEKPVEQFGKPWRHCIIQISQLTLLLIDRSHLMFRAFGKRRAPVSLCLTNCTVLLLFMPAISVLMIHMSLF